ncbi:MAG: alanine racemase, partial [Deltaproteobacteria bacterium]|nr:alanine racemase [Deltaproteobacteria bacterium]
YLIEVNIANEPSKSGISPENVFSLVEAFSAILPSHHLAISLKGLMCMPPYSDNPENSRPYFKKLKTLLDEINSRNIYPQKLTELSMGMSHDFEVAIEEGSTIIRVGTAIFGER